MLVKVSFYYLNMQQIMDILKNEIIPFKGMNYVQRYFRNYYPTEMENWEMYYQSKQIKLYYCIGSIKAIHFAYLYLFFKSNNDNDLMLHYDYAKMANLSFMNGNNILLFFMVMFFLNLLYFNFDNIIMKIANSILAHQDDSFFIEKRHRNIPICVYIRNLTLMTLNLFQVFILLIG